MADRAETSPQELLPVMTARAWCFAILAATSTVAGFAARVRSAMAAAG